jgi:hypothetical protein
MKKHLESAIGALRGTDKRNYKQWIDDLEKYGTYQKKSAYSNISLSEINLNKILKIYFIAASMSNPLLSYFKMNGYE